jgi:hypothetical protein
MPSLQGAVFAGCEHVPAVHTSFVQTLPSDVQGVLFGTLTGVQAPAPLHSSLVHSLPSSVQDVPEVSKQLSAPSLQASEHSVPPRHGSPAWIEQVPPPQVSEPLQNSPSLQGALFAGCVQEPEPSQMSSVHGLPSSVHGVPSTFSQLLLLSLHPLLHSVPPEQGSAACCEHVDPAQVSLPLQNRPSSDGALF